MVVMTRGEPEFPNQPTEFNVQEQDVPALIKRGWMVKKENSEQKNEPNIPETEIVQQMEEPKKRGRKPKAETIKNDDMPF